jgi:hypothetical protein
MVARYVLTAVVTLIFSLLLFSFCVCLNGSVFREGGYFPFYNPMNIELALQLLSTTAIIAVGPAVVVLLFLQKGNL